MNFENKILNIKKNQILLNRLKDVGIYPSFVVQGPDGPKTQVVLHFWSCSIFFIILS